MIKNNKKLFAIVVLVWAIFIVLTIIFVTSRDNNNEETLVDDVVQVHESTPFESSPNYYTDSQYQEYPSACQVWKVLRENGYNEYVSSGIIGNMMTECGGHTLNLNYGIYDSTGRYYGLCQWSLKYTPQVSGLDIEGQMDVLLSNIQTNIEYFGGDFNYFLNLQDEKEAAIYFQKYYERGSGSTSRSNNATIAYNYFTNKT